MTNVLAKRQMDETDCDVKGDEHIASGGQEADVEGHEDVILKNRDF